MTIRVLNALKWLAGLLVLVALCGLAVFVHDRMDRELRKLPDAERRALYARTLETLRTTCTLAPGPTLTEYCREQADFIERFPECDSDCRALVERLAPKPSR